jgi:putative aldouronate transport system substrate-binding protein
MWYDGEIVMQLNYAPIGVYYTGQDENGQWISITDEEAKANYGKSSGELKAVHEVYGPKLILSEYYAEVFHMEQRAMDRLNDLVNFWYTYCDSLVPYPGNANFSNEELEVIDRYKADFESAVAEQEALWLKNGGPTDEEWQEYLDMLTNMCGMNELLEIYQNAYNRYVGK